MFSFFLERKKTYANMHLLFRGRKLTNSAEHTPGHIFTDVFGTSLPKWICIKDKGKAHLLAENIWKNGLKMQNVPKYQ